MRTVSLHSYNEGQCVHKFYKPSTKGITVECIFASYSVYEDWASVNLILSKNGSTSYDATVSLTTINGTAQGLCTHKSNL